MAHEGEGREGRLALSLSSHLQSRLLALSFSRSSTVAHSIKSDNLEGGRAGKVGGRGEGGTKWLPRLTNEPTKISSGREGIEVRVGENWKVCEKQTSMRLAADWWTDAWSKLIKASLEENCT